MNSITSGQVPLRADSRRSMFPGSPGKTAEIPPASSVVKPGPMQSLGEPGVLDVLDTALNLGRPRDLGRMIQGMDAEAAQSALQSLARLLRAGVVGYEYRKVNGEPRKVFIDVALGSDLHRAPLLRGGRFDRAI